MAQISGMATFQGRSVVFLTHLKGMSGSQQSMCSPASCTLSCSTHAHTDKLLPNGCPTGPANTLRDASSQQLHSSVGVALGFCAGPTSAGFLRVSHGAGHLLLGMGCQQLHCLQEFIGEWRRTALHRCAKCAIPSISCSQRHSDHPCRVRR